MPFRLIPRFLVPFALEIVLFSFSFSPKCFADEATSLFPEWLALNLTSARTFLSERREESPFRRSPPLFYELSSFSQGGFFFLG